MNDEITAETVRQLAHAAGLQLPAEDVQPLVEALRSYRMAFLALEGLDLTGVDPLLTVDPRWTS